MRWIKSEKNSWNDTTKEKIYSWIKYLINFILCIIMPFLAVFFRTKKYRFIFFNLILAALGWLPGVIHAFIFTHDNKENVYQSYVISLILILSIITSVIVVLTNPFDLISHLKTVIGYFRSLYIALGIGCFLIAALILSFGGSELDGRTRTGYKDNVLPTSSYGWFLSGCFFWVMQWFLGKFSTFLPDWAISIMSTLEDSFNFLLWAYKLIETAVIIIINFLTEIFVFLYTAFLVALTFNWGG